MIICPICHLKYEFQESLLGQRVSCECGCSWVLTMDQVITKTDDEGVFQTDSRVEKYICSEDETELRKAFEIIVNERRASTSYLQRRLNIGYNKASSILFELEKRGVVSKPSVASGQKREVLLPMDMIFEESPVKKNENREFLSSKVFDSGVHIYPTDDDLILKAFCIVIKEKWATPTYLQKRLNIDYNLASNIITIFEKRGIISESAVEGSQRHEILLTKEQIEYYLKIYENANKEDSANNDFTELNKKNKSTEETIEELNKKIVISYTNEIYGLLSNKPLFNLLDHGYMTFTNIMIKNLKKEKILEGPKDKEGNIYHVARIPSCKELENIIQSSFYQDQRKREFWNFVKDNCYLYTFIIIVIVIMALVGYAVYDDITDENHYCPVKITGVN